MGAMLEKLGHEAHFANDGAQAIEAAVKREYDVILMDIQMPNVDGLEATRTIRSFGGRLATIPIIAVSAFYLSAHKDAAMAAGASGFLSKPVRRSVLDGALRSIGGSDGVTEEPQPAQAKVLRIARVPSEADLVAK
jgi:CheY-like chemotaxis protein